MKKFSILSLIFIIVISLLLCGSNKENNNSIDNTVVDSNNTNPNNDTVVEPINSSETDVELTDNTKESIQNKLNAQSDKIYAITWSNDNKFVAYVSGDPLNMYGQLYLWEVGKEKPEIIENVEDRICEVTWSPNNEYLLADIGTSTQRLGAIVSVINKNKIAEVGYYGKALWTPDSNYLIIGTISDIQPNVEIELSGTVDIAGYNIKKGELKIIEKGTADYCFSPIRVNEDGTIIYGKQYFDYQIEGETFEYKIKRD